MAKAIIQEPGWVLVDQVGKPVRVGDKAQTFRGDPVTITGGRPPKHMGSTGRIWGAFGEFFPSVCSMKWEKTNAPR